MVAVNEGPAAGASLDHSHSQIVPFPDVPPVAEAQSAAFAEHCNLCWALGVEDARTVRHADGLRTFAPGWSRFAYELWIAPDAHVAEPGWGELATAIADAARRLRVRRSAPTWPGTASSTRRPRACERWHWHAEVWPRLTIAASAELGAGVWINIVDPDVAAADPARRLNIGRPRIRLRVRRGSLPNPPIASVQGARAGLVDLI